jgi:2,3-dihydroxybenzoate decarboxylase/5-carboxyvanillate decarboxylase
MDLDRRTFLGAGSALLAASGEASAAAPAPPLRRIATEEAWSIPEHVDALGQLATSAWTNLDVISERGMNSRTGLGRALVDVDERLRIMDQTGVDMHVLSLTSPGVQLFDADRAVAMAALANDRMAEIVRRRPDRFAGLASFAPQDPARAAKEMERCINGLKLNGFIVNSHTEDQYLDQPKFWPILEAAEALDAPIYIHPRCPADSLSGPFRDYRIQSAIWGFAVESGTHAIRLLVSGVFDRFPRLKIVLGHMGENVPFHLWRTEHWFQRRPGAYPAKRSPMEVFRQNFWITNSGVDHAPALKYAIEVLGPERVLWAIDYPYEAMPPSVAFMNQVDIADEDRARIFHRNAEALFRIPPLAARAA